MPALLLIGSKVLLCSVHLWHEAECPAPGKSFPSIPIPCMVWLHKGNCPCNHCRASRWVRHHALAFYCRTSKENSNSLLREDLFPLIFVPQPFWYWPSMQQRLDGFYCRISTKMLFLALFSFPSHIRGQVAHPHDFEGSRDKFSHAFPSEACSALSGEIASMCAQMRHYWNKSCWTHMCCRAPVATNISPWMRINMLSCRVATTNIALLFTVGLLSGTTVI